VHLNGDLPLGYDDQTLDAIQASGGGVTGNIESALARIAISLQDQGGDLPPYSPVTDLVDGYIWSVLPTEAADAAANAALLPDVELVTHAADEPFAALAARRLILAEMQRNKGSIDQLETLDALHTLAMQYGIVTPFSSMIVLVEADQQRLLDKLSTLEDRYEREVESLGDTAPRSPMPLTGVPEPHEWLLMGMAAAMLVYLIYTKRRQGLLMSR
jgi:putative PEP-CTERM system integral membrane protein